MMGHVLNRRLAAVAVMAVLIAPWAGAQEDLVDIDVMTEADAIAALTGDADWVTKQTACRSLREVGTAASIPALAALLNEPQLAHLARYALEPMPFPEVDRVLREALASTDGDRKMGVVISLGARRDAAAVPLLTPMLDSGDAQLARAAAGALGRIATDEAVAALDAASASRSIPVAEGLLTAAEQWIADGKGDDAARICRSLAAEEWPPYVRMGAFRTWTQARPNRAPQRIIRVLGSDNAEFRNAAAQLVAESEDPARVKQFAEALPGLPVEGQVALVRGLAGTGEAAARPAVVQALTEGAPEVRLEAARALGFLGTARDVVALAALLDAGDAQLAQAARGSLAMLTADGVDTALTDVVSNLPPAGQAQAIALLAERRAEQAVPTALDHLDADHPAVQTAALESLGQLAAVDAIEPVLETMAGAEDTVRRAAALSLGQIAARSGDGALPVLEQAMEGTSAAAQTTVLSAVARIASPSALAVVASKVEADDAAVADEAVRLLSNWPNADAAPHLLELAASDHPTRKALGFRGYVRLAREAAAGDAKATMLANATELAKTTEERWLVLSAWGTYPTANTLAVLLPNLDDEAVRNEAAAAIIQVAPELARQGDAQRAEAVAALKTVLEKCDSTAVRERAQRALDRIGG